jgi:hypothetical protein
VLLSTGSPSAVPTSSSTDTKSGPSSSSIVEYSVIQSRARTVRYTVM